LNAIGKRGLGVLLNSRSTTTHRSGFSAMDRQQFSAASSPLEEYPIQVDIPVQWGDEDSFGHVNNVQYIKYFETARIAHFMTFHDALKANGDDTKFDFDGFMFAKAVGPILASTFCKFKFPVQFPDDLVACSRIQDANISDDR